MTNDYRSLRIHGILALLVLGSMVACPRRIDVNRKGEIKLRGESAVSLKGKRPGDLLQKGIASWYGHPYHGRQTANGERYDMWQDTAAHKTLPFGTLVTVVNHRTGKKTQVRINDRGPFVKGRVIDLSRKAAEKLGIYVTGTAEVSLYLEEMPAQPRQEASAPTKPSRQGFWTIQVGSFKELRRATDLGERMRLYHKNVRIEPVGDLYRVRVGRFQSKSETFPLASVLSDEGIKPWILFADREQ